MKQIKSSKLSPRRTSFCLVFPMVLSLAFTAATPTQAHVHLESPNGGETLEVGSTVTIVWKLTIAHDLINWDLSYALDGGQDGWLAIANDVMAGDPSSGTIHTYQWTVPPVLSSTVRVRIIMDNQSFDYVDISDADFTITALDTDNDQIPNFLDNCPFTPNPAQLDSDIDGVGDACDLCPDFNDSLDMDGDMIPDMCDNCPNTADVFHLDSDADGVGDVCDICPNDPNPTCCCATSGDANGDSSVNIADVTFLIARIFAGGPAPACNDQADASGDNKVNIADVTFLIARIFAGGPEPQCGTTGS